MFLFKIEQIAIVPRDATRARALLADFGATDWSSDVVVAEGRVRKADREINVATLAFNYQMSPALPLEFEVLTYRAGANWMDSEEPRVSHLGMHCSAHELSEIKTTMAKHGCPIIQEVKTISHTNPAIATTRRYHYVIFDTYPILGVDLKFIIRLPHQVETVA